MSLSSEPPTQLTFHRGPFLMCFFCLKVFFYSVMLCLYVLCHFSRVPLCVTLWTVARQAPLSLGFSRQEHWSELPCPPPGVFLTQGFHLHLWRLLHWQLDSLTTEPCGKDTKIRSDQSSILRSPFNLNSFLTVARPGWGAWG